MPSLLGSAPDQVPTNGDLGDMAYQTREHVTVEKISTPDGDLQAQIDALTTALNELTAEVESSAMVLLKEIVVSSLPNFVTFTDIDGTYDEYELRFLGVKPSSSSAVISVRISTDNGLNFISTSEYNMQYVINGTGSSGTLTVGNSGIAAFSDANAAGFSGTLSFQEVADASKRPHLRWVASSDSANASSINITDTVIVMSNPSIMNAIRVAFDTGSIASGTIKLYGIK